MVKKSLDYKSTRMERKYNMSRMIGLKECLKMLRACSSIAIRLLVPLTQRLGYLLAVNAWTLNQSALDIAPFAIDVFFILIIIFHG